MTVFEQRTHELVQSACKRIVEPEQFYKNVKMKFICSIDFDKYDDFEKAVNDFLANHYVVDVKILRHNFSEVVIFYKEW